VAHRLILASFNVNKKDAVIAQKLDKALECYSQTIRALPGIDSVESRRAFVAQLIESRRRVEYVRRIASRDVNAKRADPSSTFFDPLKAALHFQRSGNTNEAMWLVFLATHFGKSGQFGWDRVRAVYGSLGQGGTWNWARTSTEPVAFRNWLDANRANIPGRFGNHRKYESLDAVSTTGTGQVIETYVGWVLKAGGHPNLVSNALHQAQADPGLAFDLLFKSMNSVARFGRTAKFDYLTMVAKLGLANIEPRKPYMASATGPRTGANLLFRGESTHAEGTKTLDSWTYELGKSLELGMQEMEDALCNWQKSPNVFRPFRG
jgi:alpha-glutamyl/putrescinyl thymine pyrophosphorylase-like protein